VNRRRETRTGGRPASTGVIPGNYALSVGRPESPPPCGWTWTALTEVARLETGHTPSRKHPEYWGGDVPWIGIRDATENHGGVLNNTSEYTNELGIANSSARILPPGTVCLSRTASVGYVVVMGRPMATSQDFVNWVCSDALDYRFLKYVLLAEREAFLRFASGTTHQTIYFPEVKAFHVCLPPVPEQRAIAHILGTLDDKIDLNRRMNETLEAMARALFQSWFVDFEPVRAKMEGRWRPGQSLPGLPAHLYDLFSDRLVDSELGEIPEGWSIVELPDAIDFLEGPGLRNWQYRAEGMKFLNIRCIVDGDLDMAKANAISLEEFERKYSHFALGEDDIVISTSGTLGRLAIVRSDHLPIMLNTSIIRMRGRGPFCLGYVWGFLQSEYFLAEMFALAAGSVQLNFGPMHLRQLQILGPPEPVLGRFERTVQPLFRRTLHNRCASHTLAALRDTLLPKLISGELRVEDAERFVGKVV
jgi:type I restriction enzyme, S subunit